MMHFLKFILICRLKIKIKANKKIFESKAFDGVGKQKVEINDKNVLKSFIFLFAFLVKK